MEASTPIAAAPEMFAFIENYAAATPDENAACHVGLCAQSECGRCRPYLEARELLAKARGGAE